MSFSLCKSTHCKSTININQLLVSTNISIAAHSVSATLLSWKKVIIAISGA